MLAASTRHGSALALETTVPMSPTLNALEERLHGFARYYEQIAKPFEWKFTRKDLDDLLERIDSPHTPQAPVRVAA